MQLRIFDSAILASIFLVFSGCKTDAADAESSTAIAASRQEGESKGSASHAVDVLREDMTEAEVAAALQVTHIDEQEKKQLQLSRSIAEVRYICRGRRFPSEYIDCQFFWFSSGELRESGEYVRTSDYVLKLRNWSRVQNWGTILALDMKKIEPDFVARRTEEMNALMKEAESIRNGE